MAVTEVSGLMKYKDANGNVYLMLPITTKDNVDGMEEIDAHLVDKNNPHGVTPEQIGAALEEHGHAAGDISGLATVATSGNYEDLSNKPTIPEAYVHPESHPATMITGLGSLATKSSVAKTDLDSGVQSSLDKADSALQSFTESDPTVPAWAKEANRPSYTASEVGADPSGAAAAAQAAAKSYTDTQVSGLASTSDVNSAVGSHNTSTSAHNDIRDLINGLSTRLNALADSDDTTLDQMSEIVAYIKSNKSLIDSITTSKVSVTDIVNDLTTNVGNKPLSAAQGVAIKAMIDGVQSDLDAKADWSQNDSTQPDFIKNRPFYETDPVDVVIAEGTNTANEMLQTTATVDHLVLGETYSVVFDGTTYSNLTCVDIQGIPGVGSPDFSFTDYPFAVVVQSGRAMAMIVEDDSAHTLKLIWHMAEIIPLDRKYISDYIDAFPGEKVAGKVYTIDEVEVTAGEGAEVFNDYNTNIASGRYSHAEGMNNTASGMLSHAEGWSTKASGSYSHTEGQETTASESYAHAEGWLAEATNRAAHAEGFATKATGEFSHAEGDNANATGRAAHAEGYGTNATGDRSHAEGSNTKASSANQHVQGKYNIEDAADKYAHIVGNGTSNTARSNAHTIDWNGNAWFKGDVFVGGDSQDNGSKLAKMSDITPSGIGAALADHSHEAGDISGLTATVAELNYMSGVKSNVQTQLDKKANDFSIELYNGNKGNPNPVRFASFNYSTCTSEAGIAAKISLVSGHGNGSAYAFLEDAIIRVTYSGGVEVDNFKYYGAETGAYDGANRQYGDIFWLVDETNKIVDFYCLMGQYARMYQTPWKRLAYSTGGAVTQHTSCTVYSSGEKAWANNSNIALMSDIDTAIAAKQDKISTETWTFTLEDGSTVTKAVYVG